MSVDLFHRREGAGTPVVILHGLFGSGDNFGSIGRTLSAEFDMVLVDERDHGRSPHTDRITYPLMAGDVHALVTKLGLKDIILVGHSMGGKTAMTFAQRWPELLKHLVVIDIGPREYPIGDHAPIIEALSSSDPASMGSRKEMEAHLSSHIPEPGVVQFLMKSLYWEKPDRLGWRFNVPVLKRDMNDILAGMDPEVVRVPTLFIRGGKSGYITREDLPQLKEQFPNSRVETIAFAGHWVHAQAPDEVMDFIRSVA
ncbi:MAG: alpha/beta fold hydrolase [Flavobacteriales bacterium]|jgi:pimeloyl-ACP methyl ester carboxylesterase|nr:alpha/beta fold hydrolase [Flavobacteriales bacterium]